MARSSWSTSLRRRFQRHRRVVAWTTLGLGVALLLFVLYLDQTVRGQFEGKRWALPARVYAQPMELFNGRRLKPEHLVAELGALRYRPHAQGPGSYVADGDTITVHTRAFAFWDGVQPALKLRAVFHGDKLAALYNLENETAVSLARIDPLLIGSIYPAHNEDRVLVQLAEVPKLLTDGLIAVEDRKFYRHAGIDPRGIARAAYMNLRNRGGNIQGGSTLTQQLVKNFYLTAERTLRRKITEAIMASLLEIHYDKPEILEAYLNEIYLGQNGNHGIHGFGLASQFYFGRTLADLGVPETALLVGLVKGPSFYDPRRHPQRAKSRRDLVLAEWERQGVIDRTAYLQAKQAPLGVIAQARSTASAYPAFLDLVHRQLRRDYRDEDLRSEGLKIFTTLEPRAQRAAEEALHTRLTALERARGLPPKMLEGAVVMSNADNGEVVAVVGGRDARFAGFNRALDAQRPIGSLVKPVVFLTALQRAGEYTLATPLDDDEFKWRDQTGKEWVPLNYDKQYHGRVPLRVALINSYNVSTARLGINVGVNKVIDNMQRLGVERDVPAYGSTLLGASPLTPLEVTQMYQTLATGFRTPLRAIREVLTADNAPLQRYALSVTQAIEPGPLYLLTTALQDVVREGTGNALQHYVSADLNVAGKTGTTDDLRDGWFAGFTGDRVAVVWVGRDDNKPALLTGASGALTVWGTMMAQVDPAPLKPELPENVERVWVDPATAMRADSACRDAVELPFIKGSAPVQSAPCATRSPVKAIKNWLRRLFER